MESGTIATFDPSSDPDSFRGALGSFVTGVTIVATVTDSGPVGIVANSFASVSLDPPLVLWSPAKGSKRFADFAHASRFSVHVLSAEQRDLCAAIIKSKHAIADIQTAQTDCGMPIIPDALASFDCTLWASHDAGDHVVVIGRVNKAHHRGGAPLVFHSGTYGRFSQT